MYVVQVRFHLLADIIDESLVPLLLEKLTSAGNLNKGDIRYVTHRV
jgi:hypothetical protein